MRLRQTSNKIMRSLVETCSISRIYVARVWPPKSEKSFGIFLQNTTQVIAARHPIHSQIQITCISYSNFDIHPKHRTLTSRTVCVCVHESHLCISKERHVGCVHCRNDELIVPEPRTC
uniref:Uncharacterized protein n=1 Tax=Trichogramma kaykai TaxID=54128 RepID=A0ABD2WI40_9HYME